MIFDPVSLWVFGLARNAALERGCKRQFGRIQHSRQSQVKNTRMATMILNMAVLPLG
jgi:hypothetical protein